MVLVSLIYVLELFSFNSKTFYTTFGDDKSQILISICLNPIILDITKNNWIICTLGMNRLRPKIFSKTSELPVYFFKFSINIMQIPNANGVTHFYHFQI